MTQGKPKIRLYVPAAYAVGGHVELAQPQSHYLSHVMRLGVGDGVAVFNGNDGEWLAEIAQMGKKTAVVALKKQLEAQISSPDVWLAFAPIRSKTELVVEKATEIGVSSIHTIFMKHNVVTKVNMEKLIAHAVEAAEQCERHDVPSIEEHKNLQQFLASWPKDRVLFFADEGGSGAPLAEVLAKNNGKCGVLIGPEGGFSDDERRMLQVPAFVKPFSMGPRILRADTAATAALACIMSVHGDWQCKPHFTASA